MATNPAAATSYRVVVGNRNASHHPSECDLICKDYINFKVIYSHLSMYVNIYRRVDETRWRAAAAEVVGPVLVDGTTSESTSFSDSDE